MRRLIASIAALSLLAQPLAARADFWGRDSWWGRDKALHLAVGLAIGGSCSFGLWAVYRESSTALRAGLCTGLGMLPGIGKELYDAGQPNNFFSLKDLLWTSLGVILAVATGWLIEHLLRSEPNSNQSTLLNTPLLWRF